MVCKRSIRHGNRVSVRFKSEINFSFLYCSHAGCGAEIMINNIRVFGNCSCGVEIGTPMEDQIATEGACGMENCQPFWIAFQSFSVVAAALIASTLVGKIIINIRAVLPQDKALSIACALFFMGIIIYIPGKIAYRFIAGKRFKKKCC
jgi:Organic Anion Transporter Polypeptide (OATP) family